MKHKPQVQRLTPDPAEARKRALEDAALDSCAQASVEAAFARHPTILRDRVAEHYILAFGAAHAGAVDSAKTSSLFGVHAGKFAPSCPAKASHPLRLATFGGKG